MNNRLEASLDEISIELMMVDLNDPQAECQGVMDLVQQFLDNARTNPQWAGMYEAGKILMLRKKDLSTSDFVKELGTFVSRAQNFMRTGDTGIFAPSHADAVTNSAAAEVSENLDTEFLVEFIEKHTGMLDEFEAAILEFRLSLENWISGSPEWDDGIRSFQRFAKGYIHNIKGDAGSIGMTGIEKTCHFIEDLLGEHTPDTILEQLLAFKEWLSAYIRDFAGGNPVKESCEAFRNRFVEMINGASLTDKPETASAPMQQVTGIAPDANLDLLAELMADDSFKDAIAADKDISSLQPSKPAQTAPVAPPAEAPSPQHVAYQITGDQEVFQEFLVEAEEHLEIIESTLLDSGGHYSSEAIAAMFRGIHSIKGASSFYGLKEVTESSHLTENLLDEVRQDRRAFDQGLTELCLQYVDLEKNLLKNAREAFTSGGTLYTTSQAAEYIKRLKDYQSGAPAPASPKPAASVPAKPMSAPVPQPVAKSAPAAQPEAPKEPAKASGEQLEVKNYVKVETQRLDLLIDSIGEMCIYSSVLIQRCRELISQDEEVSRISHQVEKFSRDLQNIGMSMRLIPIRGLFQKMSRLVWDTARKMNKDVKFQMEGEDTELDRTIIDKLADPLMHMVRNALDHGVETPEDRVKAGKPKTGCVHLSAEHSAGSIHIKIRDDGRGLDADKLLKKAREKGLVAEGQQLSRQEIFSLIFAPGFSTAAVVTDISGRGVGMDVVKRNIESLRGRVRIDSEIGKGTQFTIELPLTLAIIDGIQVAVGPQSYIIPTLSVVEFIRPAPNMITRALDRGETFHFRGRFLPVFSLSRLFGIPSNFEDSCDGTFIIAETAGEQFALAVDRIDGTISTVIKNLGEMFEQRKGIAGCAVMANGNVALILDIGSLLQLARENYHFEEAGRDQRPCEEAVPGTIEVSQ